MSKQTEALKLALEALENLPEMCGIEEAITAIREALAEPDYKALYEKAAQQYNELAELMAEQPAKEKAPDSANSEAPGWIISDHARRDDCTTEQPYPDNFIDALMYDVARRDSEAQQAYEDAFINGTGVMLGGKRIDPASIYKQPAQQQEPVAWATRLGEYAHIQWGSKRPEYPMVYEVPLYTSPPHRKPLTDEEIVQIELGLRQYNNRDTYDLSLKDFARAIEAAHGIKENKK